MPQFYETNDNLGNRGIVIPATNCPVSVETELVRFHPVGGKAHLLTLRGLFNNAVAWASAYVRVRAGNREIIIDSELFDNVRDIAFPFVGVHNEDVVISVVNGAVGAYDFSGYVQVKVQ